MVEFTVPMGCQILRFDRGKALVRNDDGDETWIKPDQVSIRTGNRMKFFIVFRTRDLMMSHLLTCQFADNQIDAYHIGLWC